MKEQPKRLVRRDKVRRPTGHLTIKVRDVRTGHVTQEVKLKNLIVDNFRRLEVLALGGSNLSDLYIDRIQLGIDGTEAAVGDNAITPPPSGEVDVTVLSTSYPAEKRVTFQATLLATESNGETFREAGLVAHNVVPNLVARRAFDAMAKTSSFEWEFTWTVVWP